MTCDVPGCYGRGIVVPVGPDTPSVLDPETLEDVLADGEPTYVTALACAEHIDIVKRALQERHQPRRMAMREGRPPK